MSLNIKNERVHELARTAARLTGKSQTGAIEEALERLVRDLGDDPVEAERQRRVQRIMEAAQRWRDLPENPNPDAIRSTDDLYDPETGLPW